MQQLSVRQSYPRQVSDMFRPLALYIGLRYTRAKRRNHFISMISFVTIVCFALSVCALIAVLSVMNGFEDAIRGRAFSMAQQIKISTLGNYLEDWPELASTLKNQPHIVGMAPYINGQGMLIANGQAHAANVFGVIPSESRKISQVADNIVKGTWDNLLPGSYGIVLGHELANHLGVSVGDRISLVTPNISVTPVGYIPRMKPFTVQGIFQMGSGFGYDSIFAYINLEDAQRLYKLNSAVTGLELKLDDMYLAPKLSETLYKQLPSQYMITDWTTQYQPLFDAIRLEKTMMFFLLLILIVLTAFSMLANLYMMVTDKQADIAILRTLGATPRTIQSIFMVQGTAIGLLGTALGVLLGVTLALNVTDLTNWIQAVLGIQVISSKVYFVDYLPSKLLWKDVVLIASSALFASVLATLLPARLGAKVQPAEALRYE